MFQMDPSKDLQLQVLPQERIQTVKLYWETVPDKQRVNLLSIDLNELKLRADDLAEKVTKQAGRRINLPQPVAFKPADTSKVLWLVSKQTNRGTLCTVFCHSL